MRTRSVVSVLAVVLLVCLAVPVAAESRSVTATGAVWFSIPPMPIVFPNGVDVHFVFNVHGSQEEPDSGNAHAQLFDPLSGKLLAVLKARQQDSLDGARIWDVSQTGSEASFRIQFEVRQGSVPTQVLGKFIWRVADGGENDEVQFMVFPVCEVLKGNLVVHGEP